MDGQGLGDSHTPVFVTYSLATRRAVSPIVLALVSVWIAADAQAQPFAQSDVPDPAVPDSVVAPLRSAPSVQLRGAAFLDYAYTLTSPDAEEEGANSFDYRRIYLTTDFSLSDAFSGRFRLEARGSSTTAEGRPAPFVKDAWVRWDGGIADGHRLTLGVQPPPLFEVAESVWGYRSLEKTLVDRARANDSRDLGLRADGPLAADGAVSYSLMVGNGRGVRPEPDGERGKQVYAQLQARPTSTIRATLGVDYTPHEGDEEVRDRTLKGTGFLGAVTDRTRAGIEAFATRTTYVEGLMPTTSGFGVSVFGSHAFGDEGQYRVIGRYDYVEAAALRAESDEHSGLVAFGYAPIPEVEILPNLLASRFVGEEVWLQARLTVSVRFTGPRQSVSP